MDTETGPNKCSSGTVYYNQVNTHKHRPGWFVEMDGRLFEQQRNENNNKRSEVRMMQCEKQCSSQISIGPSDVLGLCK